MELLKPETHSFLNYSEVVGHAGASNWPAYVWSNLDAAAVAQVRKTALLQVTSCTHEFWTEACRAYCSGVGDPSGIVTSPNDTLAQRRHDAIADTTVPDGSICVHDCCFPGWESREGFGKKVPTTGVLEVDLAEFASNPTDGDGKLLVCAVNEDGICPTKSTFTVNDKHAFLVRSTGFTVRPVSHASDSRSVRAENSTVVGKICAFLSREWRLPCSQTFVLLLSESRLIVPYWMQWGSVAEDEVLRVQAVSTEAGMRPLRCVSCTKDDNKERAYYCSDVTVGIAQAHFNHVTFDDDTISVSSLTHEFRDVVLAKVCADKQDPVLLTLHPKGLQRVRLQVNLRLNGHLSDKLVTVDEWLPTEEVKAKLCDVTTAPPHGLFRLSGFSFIIASPPWKNDERLAWRVLWRVPVVRSGSIEMEVADLYMEEASARADDILKALSVRCGDSGLCLVDSQSRVMLDGNATVRCTACVAAYPVTATLRVQASHEKLGCKSVVCHREARVAQVLKAVVALFCDAGCATEFALTVGGVSFSSDESIRLCDVVPTQIHRLLVNQQLQSTGVAPAAATSAAAAVAPISTEPVPVDKPLKESSADSSPVTLPLFASQEAAYFTLAPQQSLHEVTYSTDTGEAPVSSSFCVREGAAVWVTGCGGSAAAIHSLSVLQRPVVSTLAHCYGTPTLSQKPTVWSWWIQLNFRKSDALRITFALQSVTSKWMLLLPTTPRLEMLHRLRAAFCPSHCLESSACVLIHDSG